MARKKSKIKPVDLSRVKRYSIVKRPVKTVLNKLGRPLDVSKPADFFKSLPGILKAEEFNRFIDLVVKARKKNKPFHLLMGAHVIKVGLSPVIIELLKDNIVTGLSFNCAGLIHDLELAFWGGTSEDVQAGLDDGSFGMVKETSMMFSEIGQLAIAEKIGLGAAGGKYINSRKAKHKNISIFAAADELDIPITVHIGIGTDTIAQHPEYDAGILGETSHHDFLILSNICESLNNGGAVANIGSAVLMPEVFLKALTVARNLSKKKTNKITTANFDMILQYRPMVNVVNRPTQNGGEGFNFVGHHEIMIPLLAWGLKQKF